MKMHIGYRDCLRACSKGILLALNGFCIIVAVFMMASFVVDSTIVQYEEGHTVNTILGYILITITAGFLIIIAGFGSIGAARENVKYLSVYALMLTGLMAFELMLMIFISLQRYRLEFQVVNWLRDDFYKNATGEEESARHLKFWQQIQSGYECCGLNGPEDYVALGMEIDISCCTSAYNARSAEAQVLMHKACIRNHQYFQSGCEDEVLDYLQVVNAYLSIVAFFSFTFEAAGILLSLWLANNLKNEKKIYKETLKY